MLVLYGEAEPAESNERVAMSSVTFIRQLRCRFGSHVRLQRRVGRHGLPRHDVEEKVLDQCLVR